MLKRSISLLTLMLCCLLWNVRPCDAQSAERQVPQSITITNNESCPKRVLYSVMRMQRLPDTASPGGSDRIRRVRHMAISGGR